MSALTKTTTIGLAAGFALVLQGSASAADAAPTHWNAASGPATIVAAATVEPFSATLAQAPAPAAPQPAPAPPAAPEAGAPESPPAARPPAVDETALRYFARQGDTRRLEAEIARLKALYPDWQPPENPLEIEDAGDPELDRVWELYSQGRYAEVRAAIAARQASEPGWQPPADLLDRLAVAEARVQLVNASNLQQWQAVIRVASATPSLLTCSEVDVLWRVARAFIETGRPDRGRDAYLYVLTQCSNDAERLATMQMATQRLPRAELDPLLATERTGSDGVGEFASIRADLARASLAEAADDAAATVAPADLDTVKRLADAEGRPSDNELLGWYALRRADYPEALARFERARAAEDSSTVSQGTALALIQLARFAEAESAMVPWREASDGARAVYLAAVANLLAAPGGATIDQAVLARAVDAAAKARDAATAQQIGWYAFSLNQFPTAAQWFATALAWKADDEPAAFGLALARQRLGDAGGLAALQREWSARSPRIAAIGREDGVGLAADAAGAGLAQAEAPRARQAAATETPARPRAVLRERAAAASPARAPRADRSAGASGRSCPEEIDPYTLSAQAALARGWCLLDLDRSLLAAAAFNSAVRRGAGAVRQDAAYGESLAYLRLGLVDRAALAAAASPQPAARRRELDVAVLTDRATSAYEAKRPVETLQALDERSRLAPERIDLLILRGFAYLDLRRYGDAEQVFSAVARTGNVEGARGLNAVRQATGRIRSNY